MLTLLIATAALAGGLPSVDVTWKGSDSRLVLLPPPGEHIADEAPLTVSFQAGDRTWVIDGLGPHVADGIPFGDARGLKVTGSAALSLCLDGGTQCRFVDVTFEGEVPNTKKGQVPLVVSSETVATGPGGPFKLDAAAAADKAFADAATRGLPVLMDFAAVWCPPCDQLEAEVLHAPEQADRLAGFVFLAIDVDDPSSWALKDRYGVSSYPTVVVARADGTEIDHMIGYSGVEPTVAWLDQLTAGQTAEASTPAAVARHAWDLVQLGREDDAKAALAGATGAEDTAPYRLVRVITDPNLDDARWLTEHAPETGHDWIGFAKDLAGGEAGKAVILLAIQRALPTATPAQAADLLATMADLDGEAMAKTWYAASATLLRASFTGDNDRDRGHWLDYADVLADAGALDEAVAFLETARSAYPSEPTWALTAARLLLEGGRPADALTWLDRDMGTAWGDNLLRMAGRRVEALQALGRGDEARTYAASVLAAEPAPPEGTDVRTTKYRTHLEDLVRDETAEAAAP